jgi:hypothetical protein
MQVAYRESLFEAMSGATAVDRRYRRAIFRRWCGDSFQGGLA